MSPYALTPDVERDDILHNNTNGHTNNDINGLVNDAVDRNNDGLVNGRTNGHTSGDINGYTNDAVDRNNDGAINGHTNGHINGDINEYTNGAVEPHTDGTINGHTNGHTNGYQEHPIVTASVEDEISNGHANGAVGDASHEMDASISHGHRAQIGDNSSNKIVEPPETEQSIPKHIPAISYENAYTHGYTDGYAKSHTDLKHQPIAIVGMSCRFPGNVSTPDEFWELCARARTGFTEIPKDRFDKNRFFHPNPGKGGTTNARGGNFLQADLTAFDAPFFSFTAQEATSLDPQQRLLLECTFEALESAGIPKHSIVGKNIGCFVGGSFSEYEADLFRDPETIPMHQATGKHTSNLQNIRI
jgi:hypothetical protein